MSFYLILPSGSSAKEFPGNTNSSFKTKLATRLTVPANYEVALVGMQYTNSWYTLKGARVVCDDEFDGRAVSQEVDLLDATVVEPADLVTLVQVAIATMDKRFLPKIRIGYDAVTNETWLWLSTGFAITFTRDLNVRLGLPEANNG